MASTKRKVLPYWKLSGFYFFYFASLGVMLPYWNPYLHQRGFTAAEIASMTAIVAGTKIFAPYLWGWLADSVGNRVKVIQLASLGCLLLFPFVMLANAVVTMAFVILLFSFFWNASLPQFEATTLSHLGEKAERYSQIRLWGSVGFIAAVLLAGYIFDRIGLAYQPLLMVAIFSGIFLISIFIKNKENVLRYDNDQSFLYQLKHSGAICLLFACFLMQFSHGAYYTFYSIYLQEHGYSESMTGFLWALGTLSEIFVFIFMHRFITKYAASRLLISCFVLTAVRWLVMAYAVDYLYIMAINQLLHAFSFGLFHATAIHLVHHYFKGKLQGRGQALYSACSFGVGGAAGALLSGYFWNQSAELTFLLMSLAAILGALVSLMVKPLTKAVY